MKFLATLVASLALCASASQARAAAPAETLTVPALTCAGVVEGVIVYDVSFPYLLCRCMPAESGVNWKETKQFVCDAYLANGETVTVEVVFTNKCCGLTARLYVKGAKNIAFQTLLLPGPYHAGYELVIGRVSDEIVVKLQKVFLRFVCVLGGVSEEQVEQRKASVSIYILPRQAAAATATVSVTAK